MEYIIIILIIWHLNSFNTEGIKMNDEVSTNDDDS